MRIKASELNALEKDVMYLLTVDSSGDIDKKLPIRFDPKISSFKTNIQEQKIDTIGGRYPIFFRNGNVNYREIGISGLISYWMMNPEDECNLMEEKDLFDVLEMPSYNRLNTNSQDDSDYVGRSTNLTSENIKAERKFRDEVFAWLTNGYPKMFISPTEGNYVVRLMNVSLSPNETLGRMLYTFQCTAYECDSLNIIED